MVSQTTFVGVFLVMVYTASRLSTVMRQREYTFGAWLSDLLAVLVMFMLLVGKFQTHYIVWLLPLLLLYAWCDRDTSHLRLWYCVLGLLPLFGIVGSHNIGVFFLDAVPWGTVDLWLSYSPEAKAWSGFACMLILLLILGHILARRAGAHTTTHRLMYLGIAPLYGVFFVVLLVCAAQAYGSIAGGAVQRRLASESSLFHFPFVVSADSTHPHEMHQWLTVVLHDDFESSGVSAQNTSGSFGASPWFFYSYGAPSAIQARIQRGWSQSGQQALVLEVLGTGAKGQINRGREASRTYIPVAQGMLYTLEARVDATHLHSGEATLAVRFADMTGRLIPGSDHIIGTVRESQGWQTLAADFFIRDGYAYAEPIFSVSPASPEIPLPVGTAVFLDDIVMAQKTITTHRTWQMHGLAHAPTVQEAILAREETRKHFHVRVSAHDVHPATTISDIHFNGCGAERTEHKEKILVYIFDIACMQATRNTLHATVVNDIRDTLTLQASVAHTWSDTLYLPSKQGLIRGLFLVAILVNGVLMVLLVRALRRTLLL